MCCQSVQCFQEIPYDNKEDAKTEKQQQQRRCKDRETTTTKKIKRKTILGLGEQERN
jgi:hypothetical protein